MKKRSGIEKIQVNGDAVAKLLKSAGVASDLEARGGRIAGAAGPGHTVDTLQGRDRVSVIVRTDTNEARRNEAESRTLSRALDAGR